jgi:hypothetical protein
MNSFKIVRIRTTHYGDSQIGFVGADGKVKDFPQVGRIWKWEPGNAGWSAKSTVVESKVAGLLRYEPFRSKVAKPLTLAEGEVYLPLSVTGRNMFFKVLPEVNK